uniref:TM2 domain-containing protein n=1 Tax=Panagrolaimus sp. JU765 TaxID=591449 RepID=A0AC34RJ35_9BILA
MNRFLLIIFFIIFLHHHKKCLAIVNCNKLLIGQYYCSEPELDLETEQPKTCNKDNSITLNCTLRPGLKCKNNRSVTTFFEKKIENACRFSASKSHVTTLIFSVFFGIFGADRFYLGHYTMGCFKLFSCGFFLLLYVIDIVFIALERIGPVDESFYHVEQYGSRVFSPQFSNETTLYLFNCFDCVK